jgi:molybdenum cofactor cytidylyltransferase
LLAAGESRRWGADNKLLAPVDGKPMVRHTAEAILESGVRPVLVVTGHEAADIQSALAGLKLSFHHAPDFADGMSASLKAGVAAVPDDCSGALICLGDMPFVRPGTLDRLADAHAGQAALFPTYRGKRGNPVLLARSLFADIMRLSGDEGARTLLRAIPDQVGELAVDDPGILRDVDQPDALRDTFGS